jgi:peptide/nickel transport system permease protein
MGFYIIRRITQAAVVLFLVSVIVFLMMRLLPGDPIQMLITESDAAKMTEEQITALKHEFGLDRPLLQQYVDWISGVVHGDLGISIFYRTSVSSELKQRVPVTLHLGLLAMLLSIILGGLAGVVCAVRRGTWWDTTVTMIANAGVTIPVFWLGIMLLYLFSLKLGWLPSFGYTSPFKDFWMSLKQTILPVCCLSIVPLASITRQTRSSVLEVMHQDYIRTAWAKGLEEAAIVARHALKNSLIPVITLIGLSLSHIVGGSVLIETVFSVPGMGRLAVVSVLNKDYPLVQGIILLIAFAVALVNLIVDISYGWLDPRIRYE